MDEISCGRQIQSWTMIPICWVFCVILKKKMEQRGIDPRTSHMLSERSTIWATAPSEWCDGNCFNYTILYTEHKQNWEQVIESQYLTGKLVIQYYVHIQDLTIWKNMYFIFFIIICYAEVLNKKIVAMSGFAFILTNWPLPELPQSEENKLYSVRLWKICNYGARVSHARNYWPPSL